MNFTIKIYNNDGSTYLGSISPNELLSYPRWSSVINGGQGQCVLDLNRPFNDFGEGVTIRHGNIFKIYINDEASPLGRLIYTGVVSQYVSYSDGAAEGVRVHLLGLYSILQRTYYNALAPGGLNRNVTYTTTDPADMIKDTIDNWQTVTGSSLIAYDQGLINNTGQSSTIEFTSVKHSEQISGIVALAPSSWYWLINQDGQFVLSEKPSTPTHRFTLGKNVIDFNVQNTSEEIRNSVLVIHDSGTYEQQDAASVAAYGLYEYNEDVKGISNDAQAQPIAERILGEFKNPKQSIQITINDSYDIYSIQPGDTCKILNVPTNSSLDFENLQIVKISYEENQATLELDSIRRDYSLALAERIKQG